MADFFQDSSSFVNPAYATPAQLANARAMSEALMKRSGEGVTRPAGAIAAMIDALSSNLYRNNANTLEQQAAAGNAADVSGLEAMRQAGQRPDPQMMGHLFANPMASPEARAYVSQLITPQPITSAYGQPGYQSPSAGVVAPPIRGAFTPGYRGGQGAEGTHTEGVYPAPGAAPVQPTARVWGDQEAEAAGLYPPQARKGRGGPPAGSVDVTAPAGAPTGNAFGGYQGPMGLDQLAAKGREYAAEKTLTQAQAGSTGDILKTDAQAGYQAAEGKKAIGVITQNIQKYGPYITFGPLAEVGGRFKEGLVNAGWAGQNLTDATAAAEGITKMSNQLAGNLSQIFGQHSQAETFNNLRNVPGIGGSAQGALNMARILDQSFDKQQQLLYLQGQLENAGRTGQPLVVDGRQYMGLRDYPRLRSEYLAAHPIINPATGQDIQLEMSRSQQPQTGGRSRILKVHE